MKSTAVSAITPRELKFEVDGNLPIKRFLTALAREHLTLSLNPETGALRIVECRPPSCAHTSLEKLMTDFGGRWPAMRSSGPRLARWCDDKQRFLTR